MGPTEVQFSLEWSSEPAPGIDSNN